MARDIARGEIVIGVDLDRVGAELRATEAQFAKTMANIDRMSAEAEASIDTKRLRRDIAEIKSELRALEATDINPDIKLNEKDQAQLKKDIATAKAMLKELDAEKIIVDVNLKELKELADAEKKLAAEERKYRRERDSYYAKLGRQFMAVRRQADEDRRNAAASRRELDREMTTRGKLIQLVGQQADEDRRRAVEAERLRLSYIKIHDEIERGQRLSIFGFLGDENARVEFNRAKAELDRIGAQLRELGDSEDDLRRLARASDKTTTRFRDMLSSVSSIRLQMGFFSATLRQAATGFTLLGPIIFGVAGQLVSLVGVLGTGLAGALAVSAAGAIGFAGAALGIGLILKPMISDLQDAKKASDAYGDAVRKYGKGSTEAQTAQEKLNKTLGDIGPEAREGFRQLGQMSDRWTKLTAGNRDSFFDSFGRGIKLASSYLPMFARESNRTFKTAMSAGEAWINMFDAPEARAGIQSILSNFRAAIPNLNAGFISIGKTIGKIGASASRWLEPLSAGFEDWADNLFTGLDKNGGLDARIDRVVEHMRRVGQFAQSAGTMLATFFSAGANQGASLLTTLSNIFDRWTAWMNSTQGQKGLAEFFATANEIGSQFFATLGNLGRAVFEFSQAFAPLSQGFVAVVNAVTAVTAAIMGLAGARQVVTALGGALAGLFIANKLTAVTSAVTMLAGSFSSFAGAAGGIGALVASLNPITLAVAGLGASIAFFATLETDAAQAAAATDDLASSLSRTKAMIDALAGADSAAASAKLAVLAAQIRVNDATEVYNDAVDRYGRGSRQAREADVYRRQALMDLHDSQLRAAESSDQQVAAQKKATSAARSDLQAVNELVKKTAEAADRGPLDKIVDGFNAIGSLRNFKAGPLLDSMKDFKELVDGGASASEVHAAALKLQAQAARQFANANNKVALSQLNAERTAKKQIPVSEKLANVWNRIGDVIPRGGDRLFKLADPKETGQLMRLTDQLRSFGQGTQAGKILLNSKSVDEALAKLRQVKNQSNILVDAKVNKGKAEREIQSLGKGKTATINAKADTKSAQRDMSKLTGKQLVNRITIRANNADAMSKLNAVERKQLRTKLLQMKANPAAINAAIALINGKKIPDKIAKFKAEAAEAENANKKVQGFRDKTVTATTKWAGESEMSAAQSAIAAIQSKTVTVTTNYQSNGSPGRAAGGPTAGAYAPMPAQEKRHAESANRAGTRQSQPGVYRRPTLLVGEENRREWVIAENPSYRGANERYLQDAAANFGYRLMPFDANAATGADFAKKRDGFVKKQSKRDKKGKLRDERHGGYSYDFIQSQISLLSDKSSNLETERNANIERNPDTDPSNINPALSKVLGPLYQIKNKWYDELAYNLKVRSNQAARAATRNSKKLRGKDGLNDKFRDAKRRLQRIRNEKPENEKERKSKDKRLRSAEKQFEKARTARDNARRKVNDRGDSAGALWRELQQVRNDRKALENRITAIKDNNKPRSEEPGGGSDTPFGVQLGALDKSRYDVWQEFAGNILPNAANLPGSIPGGPLGAPVNPALPGSGGPTPLLGPSPAAPSFYSTPAGSAASGGGSSAAGGSAAPSGSGGTTVKQVINISEPPPDPHSFSKQLGWEAAAMLG